MMKNLILGQVLASVFGKSSRRRGGGMGGMGSAALGGVLGGVLGRRRGMGGARGALLMMLLPLAMRWVQRNGGIGAVLKRLQERGYGRQASSWVAAGDNEPLDPQAVEDVVGREELASASQQLGLPQDEVRQGFAEILPEMVDQLTPDGRLDPDADEVLNESVPRVEQEVEQVRRKESRHPA